MRKSNLPSDPEEMMKMLLDRRAKCIKTAANWQKKNKEVVNERMRIRRSIIKTKKDEEKIALEKLEIEVVI